MGYTIIIKANKKDTKNIINFLENRYKFYHLDECCRGLISLASILGNSYVKTEIGVVFHLNDSIDILYCESKKDFPESLWKEFSCTTVSINDDDEYRLISDIGCNLQPLLPRNISRGRCILTMLGI